MPDTEPLTIEQLEARYETLDDLGRRLGEVYGERDDFFLPKGEQRVFALFVKETFLSDCIRKEKEPEEVARAAARVFSWIACVARKQDITVQSALESKFPGYCTKCGAMPCRCHDADIQDAVLSAQTVQLDEARPRGLRDWQQLLGEMYGSKNQAREDNVSSAMRRLTDEIGEIATLEWNQPYYPLSDEEFLKEYQLEIADVTAWLIAVCNLLDVDLQRAVLEKYGNGCGKCGKTRCECEMHYFSTDEKKAQES